MEPIQNLLNWDRPGLYGAQPWFLLYRHFPGTNGAFQNRANPFHSIENRGATVLHRGLTGLTPGIPGAFVAHGLSRWRHGHSSRRPGLPQYRQPSDCFKHFKTTGDMDRFNSVHPGLPRLSTVPPGLCVNPGSVIFMKCVPVHHGIPAVLHRDVQW